MHIFKCPHCFKDIEASKEFSYIDWETTEQDFECPYCDKTFIVQIDPSEIIIDTYILG